MIRAEVDLEVPEEFDLLMVEAQLVGALREWGFAGPLAVDVVELGYSLTPEGERATERAPAEVASA